jgi:hypothetical protein
MHASSLEFAAHVPDNPSHGTPARLARRASDG